MLYKVDIMNPNDFASFSVYKIAFDFEQLLQRTFNIDLLMDLLGEATLVLQLKDEIRVQPLEPEYASI